MQTHWIRNVEKKDQNPGVLPVRASTAPQQPPEERRHQKRKHHKFSTFSDTQTSSICHCDVKRYCPLKSHTGELTKREEKHREGFE